MLSELLVKICIAILTSIETEESEEKYPSQNTLIHMYVCKTSEVRLNAEV